MAWHGEDGTGTARHRQQEIVMLKSDMSKTISTILIALIFASLSSPVLAGGRVSDDTRPLRQAAVVNAQRQDSAARAWRAFVVETVATGDYTAHYQANGQSAGYDRSGVFHLLAWLPNSTGSVSVAVVGDNATCRIFDSRGQLLSEVLGGNTASCSVVPR